MSYKFILTSAALASSVFFSSSTLFADAGYRTITLEVAHRTQPLPLHIWYPARKDGTQKMLGKNAVFKGVSVRANASSKPGKFPIVVLSHGSGGNAVNIAWIATHLAEEGMIVVATNHPGTTSRDSSPAETVKIWQRPADLSAMLTFFEKRLPFGLQADMKKVGAVGFSLGGYSVLGLSGARVSKAKYIEYCNANKHLHDCAWYAKAGVDLRQISAEKFQANFADVRLKTVVTIDPALAQAFKQQSIAQIKFPTLVINLGKKGTVPAGIDATKIARALPNRKIFNIKGATHFSFLGECTKIGERIIKNEDEEPICSEVGTRSRQSIHDQLKTVIAGFLTAQFR